jgi:hypothetical protein
LCWGQWDPSIVSGALREPRAHSAGVARDMTPGHDGAASVSGTDGSDPNVGARSFSDPEEKRKICPGNAKRRKPGSSDPGSLWWAILGSNQFSSRIAILGSTCDLASYSRPKQASVASHATPQLDTNRLCIWHVGGTYLAGAQR